MRVYISGPITGNPDYKEHFEDAAHWIARQGQTPVNPVDIEPGCLGECTRYTPAYNDRGHTWACYLRYDLIAMLGCDIVFVLSGWERSRGAQLEVQVAQNCGLQVVYKDQKEEL